MEYFDVYNNFGEKTGQTIERSDAHKSGICHRVVHLWIINSQNQILLQQRSPDKGAGANLWYVSAAGHIEASESVESTLIRETMEELGLNIAPIKDSIEYLYTFKDQMVENNGEYLDNEFSDVFMLKADFRLDEITIQPEEVQAVKYMDYSDFRDMVAAGDKSLWQHKIGYKMLIIALDNALM